MTHKKFNDFSAMEAIKAANMIAVSPFVFQTVAAMQKFGMLRVLGELLNSNYMNRAELAKKCNISSYACNILLDLAEAADVVIANDNNEYRLSKVGMYLNDDPMTIVNFNFTKDVCYQGLERLIESLEQEKPVGLEHFTEEYSTIYPFLSKLPNKARESWFAFDHFYSDHVFASAIPMLFAEGSVKSIYDIGGNTGRFSIEATTFDKEVDVTIIDLPEQCALAMQHIIANGLEDRIHTFPVNILENNIKLPNKADLWWMSQFLDCFSEKQIADIIALVYKSMKPGAKLVINELFGDRQKNDVAKLVIEANSLYFTALANGVSRFYHADTFIEILEKTGFTLDKEISSIGMGHTLLILKK
jgi:hypothetical protein